MLLDSLPTTPNGKVDRKALPSLDAAAVLTSADATEPSTERRLAEIWQEVLGLPSVGVPANFFDLGGHSLRALRVVLKVGDELGVELPVMALLQSNTIRRFAAVIDQNAVCGARPLAVPLNDEGNPRLFIFHPLGGHIFGYAPLGRALNGIVTLLGLVRRTGSPSGMAGRRFEGSRQELGRRPGWRPAGRGRRRRGRSARRRGGDSRSRSGGGSLGVRG
jgi:acyl carrier protein